MRTVRLRLLGELEVEGCELHRLGRRQVRLVLKVLALGHDQPVSLDRLVDCLWGDEPPARPADQVSVLVSRVRSVLGAERVRRNDAGYTLAVDWLDLDALGEYASEAERRLKTGAVGAARIAASAGLSLIRGPLLADEPDAAWVEAERSIADALVARVRHTAVTAAVVARDWGTAAALSDQLLAADPYDEVALRALLEATARTGRPASALAMYARARRRLAEDLGVSPTAQTEALHTAILLGEVPAETADTVRTAPPRGKLPGRALALDELDALFDQPRIAEMARWSPSRVRGASGSHGCSESGVTGSSPEVPTSCPSGATSSVEPFPSNPFSTSSPSSCAGPGRARNSWWVLTSPCSDRSWASRPTSPGPPSSLN